MDIKHIKKIQRDDAALFNRERVHLNKSTMFLRENVAELVKQLKLHCSEFDTIRKFNKGLVNSSVIHDFLSKYSLSLEHHDCIRMLVSQNIFRRITQAELNERFKKMFNNIFMDKNIRDMRGDHFPEFVYGYLPGNMSVKVEHGMFAGIRQHYTDDDNSVNVKMYVSSCLEPEFEKIYNSVMHEFLNTPDELVKICAVMSLITMTTGIRPGVKVGTVVSHEPEGKVEKSTYGLTTLKNEHFSFDDGVCRLDFHGKKGTANKFALTDPPVVNYMKSLVDRDMIFKYDGKPVDYGIFLKYILKFGFVPSDYRKRVANLELHDCFCKYSGEPVEDFLKDSFAKVAVRLNHSTADGSVAVNSYCNPKLTLRFLSGSHTNCFKESLSAKSFKVGYSF